MKKIAGWATLALAFAAFGTVDTASAGGFVNLPRNGVGFKTNSAAYRQWGTPRMINGLVSLGKEWNSAQRGHFLTYSDISLQHGGYFPPHVSHQKGVDVDMSPITTSWNGGATYVGAGNYSTPGTANLVWWIYHTPWSVNLIFHNNSRIGGVTYWPGHADHLHVRIN